MKLTDVFSTKDLQELADEMSELAGIPLFFANADGEVVTRLDNPQATCVAYTRDVQRPCAACPRRRLGQPDFVWDLDDLVQTYPCPSGLLEIALPIVVEGKPLGILGSVQVAPDTETVGAVDRLASRQGISPEKRARFVSALPVYAETRLAALQAVGQAVVRLLAAKAP